MKNYQLFNTVKFDLKTHPLRFKISDTSTFKNKAVDIIAVNIKNDALFKIYRKVGERKRTLNLSHPGVPRTRKKIIEKISITYICIYLVFSFFVYRIQSSELNVQLHPLIPS